MRVEHKHRHRRVFHHLADHSLLPGFFALGFHLGDAFAHQPHHLGPLLPLTTIKRQGWLFLPEGAWIAGHQNAAAAHPGMGVSLNLRMLLRAAIASSVFIFCFRVLVVWNCSYYITGIKK